MGDIMGKIVGGAETEANKWNFIVRLDGVAAGGTILSDHYVLTAAHICARAGNDMNRLTVSFGEHDTTKNESHEFTMRPHHTIIHEDFDQRSLENDVCLLHFSEVIPFSKNVKPACLPGDDVLPSGRRCWVAGWGSKSENTAMQSPTLQEISVALIDHETCNSDNIYSGEVDSDSMMCAGSLDGEIDACLGDSGGPLICSEDGQPILRGVVSWGFGCARKGFPGVYADISKLKSWIQKNMDRDSSSTMDDGVTLLPPNLKCETRRLGQKKSLKNQDKHFVKEEKTVSYEERIVGGEITQKGKWKWIVRLPIIGRVFT